jgi:hypothetical protein
MDEERGCDSFLRVSVPGLLRRYRKKAKEKIVDDAGANFRFSAGVEKKPSTFPWGNHHEERNGEINYKVGR